MRGWPLRITFGAVGPETTVDEMLEGRGHAVLLLDQLVTLVRGMTGLDTPIELVKPVPAGLAIKLHEAGFYVALC